MELLEKIIKVSLRKSLNKSKNISFGLEFTSLIIPAQNTTDFIKLGYYIKRENINNNEIRGFITHLTNANGHIQSIPYIVQDVPIEIDLKGYSSFCIEYANIECDIDITLFLTEKHISYTFGVQKKEQGAILNMNFVTGELVYLAYQMGAFEINGTLFTPLAKKLAEKYNISLKKW